MFKFTLGIFSDSFLLQLILFKHLFSYVILLDFLKINFSYISETLG